MGRGKTVLLLDLDRVHDVALTVEDSEIAQNTLFLIKVTQCMNATDIEINVC